MLIKLIQTGGLLPIRKEAILEVDWSEPELDQLADLMELNIQEDKGIRDGRNFTLEAQGKEIPILMDKIPEKHARIFTILQENMVIIPFCT